MSIKTDVELLAQVASVIVVNGNREITPPLDASIRNNIIDSKLNIKDGGNVIQVLTGYTTELTPSDNKHLTPKKYVDDLVAGGTVVHIAGSETITGQKTFSLDTIHANTKGITWASGSYVKDTGGSLAITSNQDITLTSDNGTDITLESAGSVNINANGGTIGLNSAVTVNTSLNLSYATASTFVYSDASKNLVSLANGTGGLTNNGSGTFSYVQYQPLDSDLTSWAGVTRASGFDTFAATPSSANLASLVTDETGSGALVFATSPTLVTPVLGTPTSGNLSNCTGTYLTMYMASGGLNPADATTYYFGIGRAIPTTTATDNAFTVKRALRLIEAIITVSANTITGSNEDSTLKLRNVTQASSSTIGTFKTNATSGGASISTSFSGLSIDIAADDSIAMQFDAATFATNPTNIAMSVELIFRII
jgi:hypothetical protein